MWPLSLRGLVAGPLKKRTFFVASLNLPKRRRRARGTAILCSTACSTRFKPDCLNEILEHYKVHSLFHFCVIREEILFLQKLYVKLPTSQNIQIYRRTHTYIQVNYFYTLLFFLRKVSFSKTAIIFFMIKIALIKIFRALPKKNCAIQKLYLS